MLRARLGSDAGTKLDAARTRLGNPVEIDEEITLPIPTPKLPNPRLSPPLPVPVAPIDGGGAADNMAHEKKTAFEQIEGPVGKQRRKRRLIVAEPGGGGGGAGHGPLATESVTFKVVEAYEKADTRFVILVSHLRGSEGFGCDMISVASEAVRDRAMAAHSIAEADILRYVEVKGRSSRAGEVELTDNEYQTAQRVGGRYWFYRVFVDPNRESHFELALLNDPINSRGVRTVTRFDLGEGSGARWWSMVEKDEEPEESPQIIVSHA